jgi:hypothetical protein
MKNLILWLSCCCFPIVVQAQTFDYQRDYDKMLARTKNKADTMCYEALLPRFLEQDTTLTVTEMLYLMIGYTGQPGFKPYQDLETEKRVYRLNNEAKYNEAIQAADTFLQEHPLNQSVLIEKAFAFHQLKQKDSAAVYKGQFSRIMAAMDWSARGRTPEEAIFSMGPRDGQNFIDKYYHADLGRSGTAEDHDGNLCQMLEMKFKKAGKEQAVVLYFAIQHAVNTTASPQHKNNGNVIGENDH